MLCQLFLINEITYFAYNRIITMLRLVLSIIYFNYQNIRSKQTESNLFLGEINKNVDTKLSLLALFTAFNAIATWYHAEGEYTIEEVCDRYFEVFINGLKA